MAKRNTKSYSKFTFDDLKTLGLEVIIVDLFKGETITPVPPTAWLTETLNRAQNLSLATEKAKSEFLIAPILNELQGNNPTVFAVYSGFNFSVDIVKGLQGFCDFLLAKLPLRIVPDTPIIAVVEAKLNDVITAAVPQCVAEMYATRIWNEKKGEPAQTIYGIITTGDNWLFLRYKIGMTIEVDKSPYPLKQLPELLGVLQYLIDQFK
jgi:hypothetical protein